MEEWQRQTIKDLREWNCNKLADFLAEDWGTEE